TSVPACFEARSSGLVARARWRQPPQMNGHHVAATRPYRTRLTGQLALSFRASANGAPPPSEPDRLFEDVVDPRLPAGSLRLEAFDHFRAEADRNRNLLRCGLWAARFGERLQHLFGQDF